MKGTYKDNLFTLDQTIITSPDNMIEIESDINVEMFAIVTYSDGLQRTIQFKQISENNYKGRFKLYEHELIKLTNGAEIQLCVYSGIKKMKTNKVKLTFDILTIKNVIQLTTNSDILKLNDEIQELKSTVSSLIHNRGFAVLPTVSLDHAEPGMVPVLATKSGVFILKHPFANVIESVNEKTPEGGNITLTIDDIKSLDGVTLTEIITLINASVKSLFEYNKTLLDNIKDINSKLIELELKLNAHLSNPII